MATETTVFQFEKQALDNAEKELERAKQEFADQLAAYEKSGKSLAENLEQYVAMRKRWLQ